jgi:L-ascorbate metabolism protein UlaG (beta-lactamase superfamily)
MAKATVHYLFNSGFAVRTEARFLLFDYWNTAPLRGHAGLAGGVVTPADLCGLDVTVFASHAHMDHFNPAVLKWQRELPGIRYVLSDDIDAGSAKNVTRARPDETYNVGGIRVRTLKSTDEGVAFIVEAEGLKIYHAGDLNWWHWEGEPDDENAAMGAAYKAEIDKLRGQVFDLAFVPVDPRLEAQYLWGLDYFMKTADARVIFPMHFMNKYSVFDRLLSDPASTGYRDRIVRISRRGERFDV